MNLAAIILAGLALTAAHPVKNLHHPPVDPRITIVRPWDSKLNRMAYCESTSRWNLNTGNGFYGGLQFSLSTWYSIGGRGLPSENSEIEQKYRAVLWHNKIGTWVTSAGWPICGYR